jgi:two-component sensor histidine kinase
VADDGVGLPAWGDERPRAGSLGLQLVVMMVEQIEGRIAVGPGPGAHFTIVFPLNGRVPAPA